MRVLSKRIYTRFNTLIYKQDYFFFGLPVLIVGTLLMAAFNAASVIALNCIMPARSNSLFLAGLPNLAKRSFNTPSCAYSVFGIVKLSRSIFNLGVFSFTSALTNGFATVLVVLVTGALVATGFATGLVAIVFAIGALVAAALVTAGFFCAGLVAVAAFSTGAFGAAVADVNDLKRSAVLGVSEGVDARLVEQILIDNPFGNASQKTPICIIKNYINSRNF